MKRFIRDACIGIFLLGILSVLILITVGLVSLWVGGMWYVPVAMVIFALATIGMLNL